MDVCTLFASKKPSFGRGDGNKVTGAIWRTSSLSDSLNRSPIPDRDRNQSVQKSDVADPIAAAVTFDETVVLCIPHNILKNVFLKEVFR